MRLADLFFLLGSCFILISVFFEWRHTQSFNPETINVSVTAWETGLLGGQGLFLSAALFLVIFPFLRRCFRQLSPRLLASPFLVLLALMLLMTLKQVLRVNAAGSIPTHLHTYLSIGFYLTMIGSNLLIFAFILAFNRIRK